MSSPNWQWIETKEYLVANATRQPETIPPNPHVDLAGCTVLITGASGGLGLESARQIYDLRPKKLILAVRDEERGRQAKAELEARRTVDELQRHDATIVQIERLDQSSFASVRRFAQEIRGEQLNVVMLNVGVVVWQWILTGDGYEKALQVNYLSTALLAFLLLPVLRRSEAASRSKETFTPSRLIFTSSDAHYNAPISYAKIPGFNAATSGDKSVKISDIDPVHPILSYLTKPANYDKYTRYLDTKLLLLLFARQLAAETPSSSCITSSVHPGFISTRLFRDARVMNWISQFWPIKRLICRTVEQGARGMVNAAIVQGEESHGKYMSEAKIRDESSFVRSEGGKKMQEQVWKETVKTLQEVVPPPALPAGVAESQAGLCYASNTI